MHSEVVFLYFSKQDALEQKVFPLYMVQSLINNTPTPILLQEVFLEQMLLSQRPDLQLAGEKELKVA